MNFLYQIINIVYKKGKSVLLDVLIPSCQRYMLCGICCNVSGI